MADLLLIDDSEELAETLADLLRVHGYTVRLAADGLQALKLLDERFPQLVLSDVEMPVLDGPSMIYRMFVENLGRENIPIILMSGSSNLSRIAAVLGTPYFITKPFELSALITLIGRALQEAIPPRPQLHGFRI